MVDTETGEVASAAIVPVGPSPLRDRQLAELSALFARMEAALTGEATPLDRIPDDLHRLREVAKAVYAWSKRCEEAVLSRMLARGAKRIGTKGLASLAVKSTTTWEYDEAQLRKLLDLVGKPDGLTTEEYEAAIRYKFDPDKRVLNELVKRGGPVAETINLGVRGTTKHALEYEGRAR